MRCLISFCDELYSSVLFCVIIWCVLIYMLFNVVSYHFVIN